MADEHSKIAGPASLLEALDADAPIPGLAEDEVAPKKATPGLAGMPLEERRRKAFDLSMRGASIPALAELFGVDESTIYRWRSQYASQYRQQLEQESGANIVADNMLWLTRIEEVCLYEVDQMDADAAEIDETTGVVSRASSDPNRKERSRWVDKALKARQMKIDLLFNAGVLKKEPEKIYHTMKGDDKEDKSDAAVAEISKDDLMKDIEQLVRHGRRL